METGNRNPHEPVDLQTHLPSEFFPRQPDLPIFLAFIGILGSVVMSLLQIDHAELDWKWSALFYLILIVGFVWTFIRHLVPHRRKFIKVGGSIIIAGFVGAAALYGILTQYRFQNAPAPVRYDEKTYSELGNLENTIATN